MARARKNIRFLAGKLAIAGMGRLPGTLRGDRRPALHGNGSNCYTIEVQLAASRASG